MMRKRIEILQEQCYAEQMRQIVEPYLAERETSMYLEREPGQRIFCVRYFAENAKGTVLISHGYTETAEKYKEILYYFLKEGYHVYMPEHCGHGRSYRLSEDLSLVHIDHYERYVRDLLLAAEKAKNDNQDLPLYLYGHSMGGGIAAAAAAQATDLFCKVILSSPMIRPLTAPVPWQAARWIAAAACCLGKENVYIFGHHPYSGEERFEDSASVSRERFAYYQEKRKTEALYQTCAASYGWLNEAFRLNRFLRRKAWKQLGCPVLVFQAEWDRFVSPREQERFVKRMHKGGNRGARLTRVPGVKHEIFNSPDAAVEKYWRKVFIFLEQ